MCRENIHLLEHSAIFGFAGTVADRVGVPAAKVLWGLSEADVQHVRETLAELRMIEEGHGWLDVSTTPDAGAVRARVALLGQEFGAQVEGWPIERVRDVLKTRHYFHAIHFPHAFHINPLAYALALAAAAERAGAQIFEHTPALAIDPAGVRKRIVKARLRARIVLAGNIHLGAVAKRLAATLVPVTAYAGAGASPERLPSQVRSATHATPATATVSSAAIACYGAAALPSGAAADGSNGGSSRRSARSTRNSGRSSSRASGRATTALRSTACPRSARWSRACGLPADWAGRGLIHRHSPAT
jgi:glycine/D-amino acid oxidase-like deaminating enzyme